MEEIIFKSDDLLVMNLINYFITEKKYNPMIIHGVNNEIWLENLNSDYKIIRIVSHHIHNKEQLDFDKFKLNKIVKQIKRKTLSLKVKVLNIYTDIEDENILSDNDVFISKEEDINKTKLVSFFPDITEKTKRKEEGLEYFMKVTDSINKENERKGKIAEKLFSKKKPSLTYIIIAICIIVFMLMYVLGNGSNSVATLIKFGANYGPLTKNGEYYRLITSMFLHIGVVHLFFNMYSLYIVGKEIENFYGKIKFLIIYFISGITGSIMSLAFSGDNVVSAGASGAIFGLLGALLYFGYYYRGYIGNAIRTSVIPVLIYNLILGFLIPGIGVSAHIGGLVGGVLSAMMCGVSDKTNKTEKINGLILTLLYISFISYLAFNGGI